MQLRQAVQRRLNPFGTLASVPNAGGRLPTRGSRRIVVYILLQPSDLDLGFDPAFLQCRLAAERRGPDAGPHTGAVLGDAVEIDQPHQPLLTQEGDGVGEQTVEGGVDPKGDAQSGIEGGVTGSAAAGEQGVGQGGDIQPATEVPDDPCLVVDVEQSVDGGGIKDEKAIWGPQTRRG